MHAARTCRHPLSKVALDEVAVGVPERTRTVRLALAHLTDINITPRELYTAPVYGRGVGVRTQTER